MTGATHRSRSQLIDELVPSMLAHLDSIGVDLQELAANPAAVVVTVDDLVLGWIEPGDAGPGCSVAAMYSATEVPPRISVVRDASPGRRAFSVLHEFGHHLCTRIEAIADAFWDLPDNGKSVEEDLADAFAAQVLLPDATVDTVLADGVDARAVLRLWQATSASREACCVAAAQRLPAPGYVMLLRPDATSQFTARHGDAVPIARGSRQTAARLQPALRGGTARGSGRPTLPGGVQTAQMYLDAATADGYTVAVWVTDSPAWDALPAPLDTRPVGNSGYCGGCAREFTTWKPSCRTCAEPHCPDCGTCDCEPGTTGRPVTERRCDRCFTTLPLAAFDGDATVCNEH
ncbi:ImmA/IrrE family metallo-endopeptidase [Actinoplanes sp. NPDC026670]|uniref:ImmA/IrrE family metallo-endopeptidase n=1 Tax=Actinoplanes sp. NPDC026670 TaxID=3154700 RepID=UPI0033C27035